MFEKEAEEYQIGNYNYGKTDSIADAFQDGAEFGYNKANEWHYPSKGEYPKDNGLLMSGQLILLTKMKGTDNLSISIGQYNFSTQEFSYQHIVGLTEVYAWKELVPPSESMRSVGK